MPDLEVLRFVVEYRQKFDDPSIRVALNGRNVSPDRIQKAISEADRLKKEAKESGNPIVLPDPVSTFSWVKRILTIFLSLIALALIAFGAWVLKP